MITGTSLTHHTTHFHDEIDEGPATPGDDDDDDDDKDKVSLSFFQKKKKRKKGKEIEISIEKQCKIHNIDN